MQIELCDSLQAFYSICKNLVTIQPSGVHTYSFYCIDNNLRADEPEPQTPVTDKERSESIRDESDESDESDQSDIDRSKEPTIVIESLSNSEGEEDQEEGYETVGSRFVEILLRHLLRGFTAKRSSVRLRCCQIVALSISSMGEIE